MIGQRHYVIARTDAKPPRYWRSRGRTPAGWTTDLYVARWYGKPADALRAARLIDCDVGVEVVMTETVVAGVCHRVNITTEDPNG